MFKEYPQYDATGLAELVARKQVTATELLEAALQRAEAVEPRVRSICVRMVELAQQQARGSLQGPFAGVPFLLKDAMQEYAGQPNTLGTRARRAYRAPAHSEITRRWLDAGLLIFGRTATPELCLKAITESQLWGATHNPWDLGRTPGGSSGGAAAAVAAGIVPVAGASDGGGSIRIPASFCGLFGLKPSRGRVSGGPAAGESWEGAAQEHVLSRSVRDSARMLDLLAGPAVGDPFIIAPPAEPFAAAVAREPGRLRIGWSVRSPLGMPVDAECVRAVHDAARLLESLGHHVEEAEPEVDGNALARGYLRMYYGQVAAAVAQNCAQLGVPESDFEPDTRTLALLGRTLTAGEYVAEHSHWNTYTRALGRFHQQYDLYLTPTVAAPPARIGETDPPPLVALGQQVVLALRAGRLLRATGMADEMGRQMLARTPFTQLANLTGVPAVSVPLHWGADGLPYGVQFVARFGEEALLLSLAAQLERAQPWFERRPAL